MKKISIAIVLALGLSTNALALTFLGAPTTDMKAGQWAVGANYGYSKQDLEVEGTDLSDIKWQTILASVHLGLATNRVEVFGRVGMADMEGVLDLDSQPEFAAGLGTRITTNLGKTLSWGVAAQFLWWQERDDRTDLDMYDIQVGLGPCWRPGKFQLYGGPMLNFVWGNLDVRGLQSDIAAQSVLGAYLGGGYDLDQHWTIMAEGQLTPDAFGWGAGVQYRF